MVITAWKSYGKLDVEREYLILLTFLPRKNFWSILTFFRYVGRIQKQMDRSRGLLGYSMKMQLLGRKAWTLSVWEDEPALQEFVTRSPHLDTMRKPILQPGKSRFVRWKLVGSSVPPKWEEALTHLVE